MGSSAGLLHSVLGTLLPCFGLLLDTLQLLQPVPVRYENPSSAGVTADTKGRLAGVGTTHGKGSLCLNVSPCPIRIGHALLPTACPDGM